MKESEGSCKKRRMKMLDEDHDDGVLLSQENVTVQPSSGIVTLSEAACAVDALYHEATEVQNQVKCFSAPKGPLLVPNNTAAFKPLSEHDATEVQNQVEFSSAPKSPLQVPDAGAAEEVMVTTGSHGAASNHSLPNDDVKTESSIDSSLIDVEGYRVKKEVAPMLQRIFDKHKDIARDCKINDRTILVPILEMICSFCHKLENLSLNIMDTELEDMTLIVENFRLMGFDLKWLSERLKELPKVKQLVNDCVALKEEDTKIQIKQKDVSILKRKLSTAETELKMMKTERHKARRNFKQRRMARIRISYRSYD